MPPAGPPLRAPAGALPAREPRLRPRTPRTDRPRPGQHLQQAYVGLPRVGRQVLHGGLASGQGRRRPPGSRRRRIGLDDETPPARSSRPDPDRAPRTVQPARLAAHAEGLEYSQGEFEIGPRDERAAQAQLHTSDARGHEQQGRGVLARDAHRDVHRAPDQPAAVHPVRPRSASLRPPTEALEGAGEVLVRSREQRRGSRDEGPRSRGPQGCRGQDKPGSRSRRAPDARAGSRGQVPSAPCSQRPSAASAPAKAVTSSPAGPCASMCASPSARCARTSARWCNDLDAGTRRGPCRGPAAGTTR